MKEKENYSDWLWRVAVSIQKQFEIGLGNEPSPQNPAIKENDQEEQNETIRNPK